MGVKKYSLARDGEKYVSPNFRVREFRCKDGTDKILISDELVRALEDLRLVLGCSINLNSGYRTKAHNKAIGGSATSKHMKGIAADVICKRDGTNVSAKEVCCRAQDLDLDSIQIISGVAVHIDVRGSRYWRDERTGKKVKDFYAYYGVPYPEPTATVKKGMKGTGVCWVQSRLNKAGYKTEVDGAFGGGTERAVKKFQKANGLIVDGKVGGKTRAALKKV